MAIAKLALSASHPLRSRLAQWALLAWPALGRRDGEAAQVAASKIVAEFSSSPLHVVETASPKISTAAVSDSSPEPVFVVTEQGTISSANPAAKNLGLQVGVQLGPETAAHHFLSKLNIVDGVGERPWASSSAELSDQALIDAAAKGDGQQLFQLKSESIVRSEYSTERLVQLADVTRLATALKGQADAVQHRDSLLDLLSHDLRTPLVAVITTLNHPELAKMPDNLRQVIDSAARRALQMMDSVVRLIRAESVSYVFAPIDIVHIVEEAIDLVWQTSTSANIDIKLRPPTSDYTVMLDRGLIIQVFTGLLNTLINQGVRGRVVWCTLSDGRLDERCAVVCELTDRSADLQSTDIDAAVIGFPQSGYTSRRSSGDSEGLTFARTVIARHGGALACQTTAGSGRRIVITLPLAI